MKTLHLDMEYDYNFSLFGVVSSCRDYKMAWSLNNILGINLIRQRELCFLMPGREQLVISNYEHSDGQSLVRLFRNKALGTSMLKKPFLLPEIKEYDYVLQITGALQQFLYPQELIGKLQRLTLIQYAKQFDPLTLKFKENLLF